MATVPRRLSFGAHADAYERARPEWPEEAARWLVPDGAHLVVELGAGTGKLTRAVAALGVHVVAVEPDPRMLAVLRGLGLEGVEGSAEEIPFGDGVADAVVAGSSLHWFELGPALQEIHRVLGPGGRFGFGWNHRDDRDPAIAAMSETAYAAQSRPRWARRRHAAAAVRRLGLPSDAPWLVGGFRYSAEAGAALVEAEEPEQVLVVVEHDHASVRARGGALERLVGRGVRGDRLGFRVRVG